MARIDVLPSIEIIRGLKGILDFYVWKGLPCVRAWPTYRPARQTDPSLAAALLFGAIIKAFVLTHPAVLEQLAAETVGIPRTARDVVVTAIYGRLHEASMSDFLDLLTECRDFLSSLTDLLHALDSIDTDELVVNVDQSVLPPLAATTTNQATALTALQKIDDLQDALESKALDRLLVRGMDQLFSFRESLLNSKISVISGAGGFAASNAVPAGRVWYITHIRGSDATSATTAHTPYVFRAPNAYYFDEEVAAFAAGKSSFFACNILLQPADLIHILFAGGLAGDSCTVELLGFQMTLET